MAKKDLKKFLRKKVRGIKVRRINKKASGFVSKGFDVAQKGLVRTQMERDFPERFKKTKTKVTRTGGIKTGKRGRPRGSYDPRYAKYGGVYGYRKMLAQRNRLQRIQALQEASVTPRQKEALRRIQAREQMQRMSPESKTIPDTYGDVNLGGIMQEIDNASNLVR